MLQNEENRLSLFVRYGLVLSYGLLVFITAAKGQITAASPWIWMHGDPSGRENRIFGVADSAAVRNKLNPTTGLLSWARPNGKLWLFNAYDDIVGANGRLSDLWHYNLQLHQWIWINKDHLGQQNKGSCTKKTYRPANKPRHKSDRVHWVDTSGNLWLFGATQVRMPYNELPR